MSDSTQYTSSEPSVEPLTPLQYTKLLQALRGATIPSRALLLNSVWLDVKKLKVDYFYQHKAYPKCIKDLRAKFDPAWSGEILVNIRKDLSQWIIDGQTRHAVHEQLGFRWIRAVVLRGLTVQQEAQIYRIKCVNTQRVPPDLFKADYAAGEPYAVLIYSILTKHGIAIRDFTDDRGLLPQSSIFISCIATLQRLLRRDGEGLYLDATLDLILKTWGPQRGALTQGFLTTMHELLMKYDEIINRKSFVEKLGQYSVEDLMRMGQNLRMATTPLPKLTTSIQRKICELYNERRQTGRIPLGA